MGTRIAAINEFGSLDLQRILIPFGESVDSAKIEVVSSEIKMYSNRQSWRTNNQRDIDYLEVADGQLFALKYNWCKMPKPI